MTWGDFMTLWSKFVIKANNCITVLQISVKTHNSVVVYIVFIGIDVTQDTSFLNLGEVRVEVLELVKFFI